MDNIGTYRNGQNGGGLPERLRTNPFSLPEGYFGALEADIRARAKLDALCGNGGFSVTEDYFDRLARDVFAKTVKKNTFSAGWFRSEKWVRYAAAACAAIVAGLGIYTIAMDRPAPGVRLTAIPEEEIVHYLASSADGDDLVYMVKYLYPPQDAERVDQHIDAEDIEKYLNYML